jgi:hypothetical protein
MKYFRCNEAGTSAPPNGQRRKLKAEKDFEKTSPHELSDKAEKVYMQKGGSSIIVSHAALSILAVIILILII